jgi:hypothetical protein
MPNWAPNELNAAFVMVSSSSCEWRPLNQAHPSKNHLRKFAFYLWMNEEAQQYTTGGS